MTIKTNCLASALALALLWGCVADNTEKTYTVIPVGESISIESKELSNSDMKVSNTTIIPIELTEESMLGQVRIVASEDGTLVVGDDESIYFFDDKTEKYLSSISRKGRGPNEYLYCYKSVVDFNDSTVCVLDNEKILYYSFDGEHIKTVKNDSIVSISKLNDDLFVAYNNPRSDHAYNFSLYDRDWNYIRGFYPFKRNEDVNYSIIMILMGRKFNDNVYTYIDNSFYEITENEFKQSIFMDKGTYAMPVELLGNMSKEEEQKYIMWDNYGSIAGDYIFYDYSYNNKNYSDIWSISRGELAFRTSTTSKHEQAGFPVNHNGTTVHMWPHYVSSNALYGMLSGADIEKLGIENNDNPVIIRVEIEQ